MPIHKDLPDSELHPPKGFVPAQNESFPIKNSAGLLEWISTSNLGSKWYTGSGVPAPAIGRTGDFYLDADVGDFYEKVNFNTWTLRGNVDGSDWFKGSGPPDSALGRVQDFYIDIDEGDIYEKTNPTTWSLITNIDGSDWFQGAGPPAPSLGRVQDFYINKSNGDLYEKTAPTEWSNFGNIRGPQGVPGPLAHLVEDTTPELGGNLNALGYSISNVSSYNGVAIESHAARHAPGGSDPIATGTPSTQVPDQANAAGNDASFAKANHIHNIPTAVPQNIGSVNSQGTANSFSRSDHVHNTFPIFEVNSASIEVNQTTTAGFTNGLTLNANGLAGGNYKIEWYYEWGFDSTVADFLGRVQIDATTSVMDHRENPADSAGVGPGGTDQRIPACGFAIVALSAGNHIITLDYGSGNGSTATLWRARLALKRWN